MIRNLNRPFYFLLLLLFSLTLACQAATNPQSLMPISTVDAQVIVAQAVATVRAETPVLEPVGLAGTAVNSQISTELEQRLVQIYQQVNPSVVHIFVYTQNDFLGSGTGFVFDADGHIVTNNHVIEGGDEYEVVFPDGQRRFGNVVGKDVDSDLAVLQVSDLPSNAPPVTLADSNTLQVGQFVVAIGNPFGEASSMSVGIISALGRTLESQRLVSGGFFSIPQIIQTDAAINPGNSGGPLLNLDGSVVGINSAILSRTGANSGVGYAIPVNAVRNIAPALITTGRYRYPYMGISMRSEPFTLRELETLALPAQGVWVSGVGQGTPAEKAGLIGHNLDAAFRPDGDYIIAIDGVPVNSSDDLLSYLVFETQVGETVELTVIRQGEEIKVPLILGERP
ncbi:MAG TPA: trypsin-like peptidase domain-containing protein [Chloroflexota bacterium]|nr:trypsin-like peptidase domain-containing protein [Chloroflexota bacterium]HUM69657.1 trypsin-like peptidase domain-containing protein [Chloroflexota bacterium]